MNDTDLTSRKLRSKLSAVAGYISSIADNETPIDMDQSNLEWFDEKSDLLKEEARDSNNSYESRELKTLVDALENAYFEAEASWRMGEVTDGLEEAHDYLNGK